MKDDQDTILYLPGDSKSAILKSPILKKYVRHGYEVLILDDPIDEFTVQHLTEYEKRKVKSIAKDDVNLFDNDDIAKEKQKKQINFSWTKRQKKGKHFFRREYHYCKKE